MSLVSFGENMNDVVFITKFCPALQRSGSEIATCNFIQSLVRCGYNPSVYCLRNLSLEKESKDLSGISVNYLGQAIMAWRDYGVWDKIKIMGKSLVTVKPLSISKLPERDLIRNLRSLTDVSRVIIEHSQMASIALSAGVKNYNFLSQNVESKVYESSIRRADSLFQKFVLGRESRLMERSEGMVVRSSRQTWALSNDDSIIFNRYSEKASVVFPVYGMEQDVPRSVQDDFSDPEYDIVLLGMWTWLPNRQGVDWFFSKVHPLLDKKIKVLIGGMGSSAFSGAYQGVSVQEHVENARSFLNRGRMHIIPSTSGGGIQIKSLNSVAWGFPTVATSFAMRGIDDLPDWCRLADSPHDFSEAVHSLLDRCRADSYADRMDRRVLGSEWQVKRRNRFDRILSDAMRDNP
jgi:hypothetical protein